MDFKQKEGITMASETLREKHPDKVRPHMADGSLVDRGEDPGPGKDPKCTAIEAELAKQESKLDAVVSGDLAQLNELAKERDVPYVLKPVLEQP